MTITKSTRYALYAAAEMAMAGEGLVTVAAVAKRYGIPEGALAKVFQQLVRSGLATGTRGIGGGYRLARPPAKITVLDIRAPHTETGLVGRALHGTAPKMPPGLAPEAVVRRILTAVADGEKDLPAEAFATC